MIIVVPNYLSILEWIRSTFFPFYLIPSGSDSEGIRGYSISTLLKPFMIIFTHLYAMNLNPFSYKILDICYTISGLSIIYGIIISAKYRPALMEPLFFSGIFPLILSIYVLEPICLSGLPQLTPQHVTFLLPWMAFIFFKLWKSFPLGRAINIIFYSGLLYAGYLHQKMEFVDWGKIQETFNGNNTPIIADNIVDSEFFLKNLKNNEIIWYADENSVKEKIDLSDTLTILLSNWKIYQELKPMQFWHNPHGTKLEHNAIAKISLLLKNSGYSLSDGYSFFPYHSYTFVKGKTKLQKIPWFYDLKYRDLKVPLFVDKQKIIGFEKINLQEPVYFDTTFYYFVQIDNAIEQAYTFVITYSDGTKKSQKLNDEHDSFRSLYSRSIENDSLVYSYKKFPFLSNSMKYQGSIFSSYGGIFKHKEFDDLYTIKCNKPGLTLIRAIIKD